MRVLIVGNRAIQHLLAVRLQSEGCDIFVYPGQKCGVYKCLSKVDLISETFDLIIMGSARYFDDESIISLIKKGIPYFGADKIVSKLETEKSIFKDFAKEFNIPTPYGSLFNDYNEAAKYLKHVKPPYVIKANGPARGCGVRILHNIDDALLDLKRKLIDINDIFYSGSVVIEEFIDGFEVAINIFLDKNGYLILPPTRPHKRLCDGDKGAIVAGMGTYSPLLLNEMFYKELHNNVLLKTINGFKQKEINFNGCLFINLIINNNGIKVLEFNCRMGDPAMLSNILLYENKLIDLIMSAVNNRLSEHSFVVADKVAMAVTLTDPIYPEKGCSINEIKIDESKLFSNDQICGYCIAGAETKNGKYVPNNGVILSSIAVSESFDKVKNLVYGNAKLVDNLYYRNDIGSDIIPPEKFFQKNGSLSFESKYIKVTDIDNKNSIIFNHSFSPKIKKPSTSASLANNLDLKKEMERFFFVTYEFNGKVKGLINLNPNFKFSSQIINKIIEVVSNSSNNDKEIRSKEINVENDDITVNNKQKINNIKKIQIKGIGYKKIEKYFGKGQEKKIYFSDDKGIIQNELVGNPNYTGYNLISEVFQEYLMCTKLNETIVSEDIEFPLPIGWGKYIFDEKCEDDLGFILLGLPELSESRSDMYNKAAEHAIINNDFDKLRLLLTKRASAMRELHKNGFILAFRHFGNFSLTKNNKIFLHDLGNTQSLTRDVLFSDKQYVCECFINLIYMLTHRKLVVPVPIEDSPSYQCVLKYSDFYLNTTLNGYYQSYLDNNYCYKDFEDVFFQSMNVPFVDIENGITKMQKKLCGL